MPENWIEKVPPQNLEAERAVLGSMLIEEEAIAKTINCIRNKEDFYDYAHQEIFEVIVDMYSKNKNVDFVTVAEILKTKGKLKELGGATYLSNMIDSVATAANVEWYAKIVKEKATLRSLIKIFTKGVTLCYDEEESENVLAEIETFLLSIYQDKTQPGLIASKELIHKNVDMIQNLYEKKTQVPGAPTGLIELDNLTGGFYDSNLIVVAGRPSMGKTALCLGFASYLAMSEKKPVAIFSLEMSKEELIFRLLCAEAKVDLQKVRTGYISMEEWQSIMRASGKLLEAPIYIDDSPALTMLDLRARTRRMKKEKGLSLVIIDYLQLIPGKYRKPEYRRQEIEEITRSLKTLAKELRVPVIAVSQLSRKPEGRKDKKPILSDLRESGSIEQDADTVIFIFREESDRENLDEDVARLIIAKQRNGRPGSIKTLFIRKWVKFENLARANRGDVSDSKGL